MIIPTRVYLLIALFVGILIYLMNWLFGTDIIIWALNLQADANATGQDFLGTIVIEPILFVFRNEIIGTIVAALVWPVVMIWLLLILCLLLVVAGVDVAADIEDQTDAGRRFIALL